MNVLPRSVLVLGTKVKPSSKILETYDGSTLSTKRFIDVDGLYSTATAAVRATLQAQIAHYEIPEIPAADNAPQFASGGSPVLPKLGTSNTRHRLLITQPAMAWQKL